MDYLDWTSNILIRLWYSLLQICIICERIRKSFLNDAIGLFFEILTYTIYLTLFFKNNNFSELINLKISFLFITKKHTFTNKISHLLIKEFFEKEFVNYSIWINTFINLRNVLKKVNLKFWAQFNHIFLVFIQSNQRFQIHIKISSFENLCFFLELLKFFENSCSSFF